MSAEHTPGPWVVFRRDRWSADVARATGEFSEGLVAANLLPEDARLIASAPEMLQVLRDVLDWYANTTEGDMPPELFDRIIRAVGGEVAP